MFNNRVLAVVKRELRERVMTKSFIISTLAVPLILAVIIGFQYLMVQFEGDSNTKLVLITETDELKNSLQDEFNEVEFVKDGSYSIEYKVMDSNDAQKYIEDNKKDILEDKINGVVFIPQNAVTEKNITFYSKNAKNLTLESKLGSVINRVLTDHYFLGKNVSMDDINYIRGGVDFEVFKVSEAKEFEKETGGNLVLAYILAFMLYFSLLMMGSVSLQSVIEEKSNRIVEVLLSSVNSREFMTGKIIGAAITGVLQMVIWLAPIIAIAGSSLPFLPEELVISINPLLVFYFFINFFIGLILFIGLFTTAGSMFDTPQDAQSAMGPLVMLIIIPFFITFTMIRNPSNVLAEVCSFVPFAAIMVMPVRMSVVEVPIWQVVLSFIVNVGTITALFPFAGKIFRVGILRTGKKPKMGEIVKWLKYKY